MEYKPDCRKCKHARSIPGNAHVSCGNPAMEFVMKTNAAKILSIIGGIKPIIPTVQLDNGTVLPVVMINEYGIKNGWGAWPFNFDPIWIDFCMFWINDQIEKEANDAENNLHKM